MDEPKTNKDNQDQDSEKIKVTLGRKKKIISPLKDSEKEKQPADKEEVETKDKDDTQIGTGEVMSEVTAENIDSGEDDEEAAAPAEPLVAEEDSKRDVEAEAKADAEKEKAKYIFNPKPVPEELKVNKYIKKQKSGSSIKTVALGVLTGLILGGLAVWALILFDMI